jgi:hypothetical protein
MNKIINNKIIQAAYIILILIHIFINIYYYIIIKLYIQ